MTRPKRVEVTQPPRGKARWRCLACDAKGEAESQVVALSEFYMHHRLTHYVARGGGA